MSDLPKKLVSKKSKKPLFTTRHVRAALPIIDAGLAALSSVKPVAAYARALRVATNLGVHAIPEEPDVLLLQLKEVRIKMRALDDVPGNARTLEVLRAQLDAYVDLLIAKLQRE